ncbi:prevent-host-death family protein [Xenococcus sp. PCC 7305]|uniref:type II toxin-antitoxin system Phd/YefM family antitoxin n=1 Tax=Xenococcus sp. PCC 7305 TaxID=102125 RepID=UPI0002AC75D1|nr:type II toxin-antitoxin system prevent-host-death family antitoxin [Xenococcus sp. PCC 7305]ELS03154.1 prevent-host-death family protein [Xenococcus sp. PCC 7305]
MEIINYSEARRNFKAVLDRVADDQDCTVITRSGVEDAVIMSKSQYDSIMETLYLMKSPANAQHLLEAIARDKAGEYEQHDILD